MCNNSLTRKSKWRPWGIYFLYLFWMSLSVHLIMKCNLGDLSPVVAELSDLIVVSILVIHYKSEFPDLIPMFRPLLKNFIVSCFLAFFVSALTEGIIPFLVCGDIPLINCCKTLTLSKCSWQMIFKLTMGVIVAPILEEILFRGVLLKLFLGSYGSISSILLNGFIFGVLHIAPIPGFGKWTMLLSVFHCCCFGILLSAMTYKTKNLSFAFGFHIAGNFLAFLTL